MSIMEVLFGSLCLRDETIRGSVIFKVCWEHVNGLGLVAMPDQTTTGHINTVSGPTIQRWIDRIFEIRVSQYTCRKETPKHIVRCFWLCHQNKNKGSLFLASKSPMESISCIQSILLSRGTHPRKGCGIYRTLFLTGSKNPIQGNLQSRLRFHYLMFSYRGSSFIDRNAGKISALGIPDFFAQESQLSADPGDRNSQMRPASWVQYR